MMMNKLPSAIFTIACGFLATAVHGPPARLRDTTDARFRAPAPRLERSDRFGR